jgi:hypothetical protein
VFSKKARAKKCGGSLQPSPKKTAAFLALPIAASE